MNKHTVVELKDRAVNSDPLTELLRTGAQRLTRQAVEAELKEVLLTQLAIELWVAGNGVCACGTQPLNQPNVARPERSTTEAAVLALRFPEPSSRIETEWCRLPP